VGLIAAGILERRRVAAAIRPAQGPICPSPEDDVLSARTALGKSAYQSPGERLEVVMMEPVRVRAQMSS
jgi:hypothetical protein